MTGNPGRSASAAPVAVLPVSPLRFIFLSGLLLIGADAGSSGPGSALGEAGRLAQSARAQGLAGATAAAADPVSSLGSNPAGVAGASLATFHLTHAAHVTGIHEDWFAYVQRLPLGSAIGAGVYALRTGGSTRTFEDAQGNWGGEGGSYPLLYAAGSVAWGQDFRRWLPGLDRLRPEGGAAVRFVMQQVDRRRWFGAAVDAGVRLRPGGGLSVGVVGRDLGVVTGDAGGLPAQAALAVAWTGDGVFGAGDGLLFEADAEYSPDAGFAPRAGVEYRLTAGASGFALRAGWRPDAQDAGAPGVTGGVGFRRYQGRFPWGLDYAVVPLGELGLRHAVALTLGIGAPDEARADESAASAIPDVAPVRVFYPRRGETVTLAFRLRASAVVTARLLDERGEPVAELIAPVRKSAGRHEVTWDGTIAPGVYATPDRQYHLAVQAGAQTWYLDAIPKGD